MAFGRSARRRLTAPTGTGRANIRARHGVDRISYSAPKELAVELGCPAQLMAYSARINVRLHKTVLAPIAAGGGILRFVIAVVGAMLLIFILRALGVFQK